MGEHTGRGCARQRQGGPWARGLLRAHGVPSFSASVNGDQVRMGFQGARLPGPSRQIGGPPGWRGKPPGGPAINRA